MFSADTFSSGLGNDMIRLKYAEIKPQLASGLDYWTINDAFNLNFEFWNTLDDVDLNVSIHLYASTGECISILVINPKSIKQV